MDYEHLDAYRNSHFCFGVNLDYFFKMWVIHIPLIWEIIIFNVKTILLV